MSHQPSLPRPCSHACEADAEGKLTQAQGRAVSAGHWCRQPIEHRAGGSWRAGGCPPAAVPAHRHELTCSRKPDVGGRHAHTTPAQLADTAGGAIVWKPRGSGAALEPAPRGRWHSAQRPRTRTHTVHQLLCARAAWRAHAGGFDHVSLTELEVGRRHDPQCLANFTPPLSSSKSCHLACQAGGSDIIPGRQQRQRAAMRRRRHVLAWQAPIVLVSGAQAARRCRADTMPRPAMRPHLDEGFGVVEAVEETWGPLTCSRPKSRSGTAWAGGRCGGLTNGSQLQPARDQPQPQPHAVSGQPCRLSPV